MLDLVSLDYVFLIGYFLIVFGIAAWATFKEKVNSSSSNYFLGGKNVGWFVIGASLFASNIGSEHLVGLAGSGASSGVAVGQFEVIAGFMLLLLGWVFVPFYVRSGVFTMPEFLEKRYSSGARTYLSWISIVAYVLTKISVTIAAGGIVFEAIGVPFWTGAIIIVVATGIYTIFGGLKAVLYTDMIQMFVLIGGSVAITFFGLSKLGGWGELQATVGDSFFDMWQPMDHPDFPWTGILFGAPILGLWYWCTDQYIVQRVLSARNIEQARKGTIFGGFLKMLPVFLFVLPGIIAYGLSQQGYFELESNDQALIVMVKNMVPAGVRGLVLAGLLAALMSSLSSVFNSCSTLFTIDVYKRWKPETSEKKLVVIGQVATVIMVGIGIAWIPFMANVSDQLFVYLQSVQGYISPPIAAVFLLGIFFKRLNAKGAMSALLSGFVLGTLRFVLEMNKAGLTEGTFWHTFATINFLHFAALLFVVCATILVIVSLMTAPPAPEKTEGLTYDRKTKGKAKGSRLDILLTVILIAIILMMWTYFS
ncbi:SSS family solute:Na+ symporter [Roseivirga pacifica]|uniref:Solute:Na+ symporter, SSS family n=1 Tax=Roseivirga pacifica TaxID=1267423 RepID=A0A1I0QND5_9BACT|nr:sodium:solute symporter [Roseivirga pacifica]RKQ42753.1 SSS family solute:Na+ symporter [Roseivirga pacifica]SEW28904.1 solute:Na+ symporter, SSS family [Roseivirga pacifica]